MTSAALTLDPPIGGILTALYYLSQEAERAGRHDVKAVLRSTIVSIDALGPGLGRTATERIATPTTCAVLTFFDQFVQASPAARARFLQSVSERAAKP